MPISLNKTRMPVTFELGESNDPRFKKVKIFIAHTGENRNNSIFSKETFESMIPTLPGVPIVGYIQQGDGEADFKGHEHALVIEENGIKMRYLGHAYGFIPEDPNTTFEIRDGKEWLVAEGYIWSKFSQAVEILESANGVKSQSMEITNVEGSVDDMGRLVITNAVFDGLCILGEEHPPGMEGSTIETFESKTVKQDLEEIFNRNLKEQFSKEISEMITEFSKEGASNLSGEENEKDLPVTEVVETEVATEEVVEDSEEFVQEVEAEQKSEAVEVVANEEESSVVAEPEKDNKEFTMLDFKLSMQDINSQIYDAIEDNLHSYIYLIDTYNDEAVYEYVDYTGDDRLTGFEKVSYTVDNDKIVLGTPVEVTLEFLTKEEKAAVEITRTMFEKVVEENNELKEFKFSIEKEEKEALVAQFTKRLPKETIEAVTERTMEMSLEDIKKELAYEVFKLQDGNEENAAVEVMNFQTTSKNKEIDELGSLSSYVH